MKNNQNPTGIELIGAREKVYGINKKILPFAVGAVGLAVAVIVSGIFTSAPPEPVGQALPAAAGYTDKDAVKSADDKKAEAEHQRDAVQNLAAQDAKSGGGWWQAYRSQAAPAPAGVPDLSAPSASNSASASPVLPLSARVPSLSSVNGKSGAVTGNPGQGGNAMPTPAQVAAAKAVADQAMNTPALPTAGGVGGQVAQVSQAEQERQQRESQARTASLSVQLGNGAGGQAQALGYAQPGAATAQLAALRSGAGGAGQDQMQQALNALRGGANGLPGQVDDAAKKEAWAGRQQANQKPEFLPEIKKAAVSDNIVAAGSVIPAVLISGVNSELPGQLIAQVRQDVYDSVNGKNLLIPKGTKLIGLYDSNVAFGQKRLLIAWSRLIYNDGQSFNLRGMPGSDSAGLAGLGDQVDNHYGRIFGGALLMSMISAGAQLSQSQTATTAGSTMSPSQTVAASLGQQLGQVGMAMVQKNMNVAPTLEIRQGFSFNVSVTADLALPPVKKI